MSEPDGNCPDCGRPIDDSPGGCYLRGDPACVRAQVAALRSALAAADLKTDEFRQEARRCRTLARAILDGMDTTGVLIEVARSPSAIIICAPNLDEHNLGDAARAVLRELLRSQGADEGAVTIGEPFVTGTESEKTP